MGRWEHLMQNNKSEKNRLPDGRLFSFLDSKTRFPYLRLIL
jgi:hypothetical protein